MDFIEIISAASLLVSSGALASAVGAFRKSFNEKKSLRQMQAENSGGHSQSPEIALTNTIRELRALEYKIKTESLASTDLHLSEMEVRRILEAIDFKADVIDEINGIPNAERKTPEKGGRRD